MRNAVFRGEIGAPVDQLSNVSPCAEAGWPPFWDVRKRSAGGPADSLEEEQLARDGDSDSGATSPSAGSHGTRQVFGKREGGPAHREKRAAAEASERSATCYPETEAGGGDEPKIPRSVTDGELKQRVPNPLSQQGVRSGPFPSLPTCIGPQVDTWGFLCSLLFDRELPALEDLTSPAARHRRPFLTAIPQTGIPRNLLYHLVYLWAKKSSL